MKPCQNYTIKLGFWRTEDWSELWCVKVMKKFPKQKYLQSYKGEYGFACSIKIKDNLLITK